RFCRTHRFEGSGGRRDPQGLQPVRHHLGAKVMRDAIAAKTQRFRQMAVDPETEITVCCGVTEAMLSTIMALVDPGDEVIIFEPFYENYGPDCILSGAKPVVLPLVPPDWHAHRDQLRRAFNPRTRAIIVNT